MNGVELACWLRASREGDMSRSGLQRLGAFALAHNVGSPAGVDAVIRVLVSAGGLVLREEEAPSHGG